MNNIFEENLINKEKHSDDEDGNTNMANISNLDNKDCCQQKLSSEKDSHKSITKTFSLMKLKITEHYEIQSKENPIEDKKDVNQFEDDKSNFINDFYSEESDKNSPKVIDGKTAIDINEIIGEDAKQEIKIEMIDDEEIALSPGKISSKSFGLITSYAANTNQGIVRDYNEDRVSVVINMNKPKFYNNSSPWPKVSYFGVFDGHAGNKCAEFMRDNLLIYICNNEYFPNDIQNAIKYGFKKIDEDYLKNHAFIDNKLVDNSGSCGLILLLINNLIYIANVGDSRCIGSFQNGKIQKDITLDHKPNTPYEKERILKYGGKIYQTQTPIEDDEMYKNKILVGPYRVFPGKLSVSRTVGDAEGKIEAIGGNPNVIVPLPDIFCFDLEKDDIDFFILGCDGIYDQLYSKDVFKCAWSVLNNNLDLFKRTILDNQAKNSFKGNYGDIIDMNTTSGNIVDLILKASMIRKSFDNVTCLFISFKNFFENLEKNLSNKIINANINMNLNAGADKNINSDILLRNKSNIENLKNHGMEPKIIFKEKNRSEKTLTKNNNDGNNGNNNKADNEGKNKISLNNITKMNALNHNKIKNNYHQNEQNKEENINNVINNNKLINNINNKKNNNAVINSQKNEENNKLNIFNDNSNINLNKKNINSPIVRNNNLNKNNNNLTESLDQIFFKKMHITGINNKRKKKEQKYSEKKNTFNLINEDKYRYTTYDKKIKLFSDNSKDIGLISDKSKKEKYAIRSPNNTIVKKINFEKINGTEYNFKYGNSDLKNGNKRSNSNNNFNIDKYNIKPIILKIDKSKLHQNNSNIKFNNIIKNNIYLTKNKKKNIKDIFSFKNITLIKLKKQKNDEIKLKKTTPTLSSQLNVNKNNNLIEDINFGKQRKFITNDNSKRKVILKEN